MSAATFDAWRTASSAVGDPSVPTTTGTNGDYLFDNLVLTNDRFAKFV